MSKDDAIAALRDAGFLLDAVQWDAGLQRCPTVDKPCKKNGAYIAHSDAPASVWWLHWGTGAEGSWTAKDHNALTPAERKQMHRRLAEARQQRNAETERKQTVAAERARRIYSESVDCSGHNYLAGKGVSPVAGLKVYGKTLVVPMYSGKDTVSLQFITPDGTKRFLGGGRKKGCYFPVGKDAAQPLLICEGLATGLSLYECTLYPVLVAFDAGNLRAVAEMARSRYADRKIILCADNDIKEDGKNTGLIAATAAAATVDAFFAAPFLKNGGKCDFNDLHHSEGKDAVWQCLVRAKKPEAPKDSMPEGYSLRAGGKRPGLYHTEVREEGEPVETWLCGPVEVLAMTRDRESNAWGLLLRWKDADNVAHVWPMPRALLTGRDTSAWLGVLADRGLPIAYSTKAKNLLNAFFMSCRTARRALCVNRCGWHGNAYVFPDATLKKDSPARFSPGQTGQTGQANEDNDFPPSSFENGYFEKLDELDKREETIALQGASSHNPFVVSGSLEGWQRSIGAFAQGNSRLAFAVCASLAGALLEPTGLESGGFNFIGGSSIGKTTALVAAGSVWGKGSSAGGYVLNWRATANGLEGLAALHSDAALCLDELGQIPGQVAESVAYMLGGGTGKARASTDGNAKAVRNWRVMALSTGEMSLADKIREINGTVKAGQLVRLVDIPADAGTGFGLFENIHGHQSAQTFADVVKNAAAVNHGHAARQFIAAILRQGSAVHTAVNEGMIRLYPEDADGQVRRVARRFQICAAAGEMAATWGILPWRQGEAIAAAKTCFEAWLSWRGGYGPAEDAAILAQVALFIEQHGSSRFQDARKPESVCVNRVGFRLSENDRTLYFVLNERFKSEICKGFSPRRVASLLSDRGILLPGDSGSFTRKPPCPLPEIGRKRCYTLVFRGDDDEAA